MRTLAFGGIEVTTQKPWRRYEDDSVPGLPWSLVAEGDEADERGLLQFSVGLYRGGKQPDLSPEALLDWTRELAEGHQLGHSSDETVDKEGPLKIGAASYRAEGYFHRIWTVSDGWNVARVTYVVPEGLLDASELQEAEAIVRSLRFAPRPTAQAA